jgi:hypothetical protein
LASSYRSEEAATVGDEDRKPTKAKRKASDGESKKSRKSKGSKSTGVDDFIIDDDESKQSKKMKHRAVSSLDRERQSFFEDSDDEAVLPFDGDKDKNTTIISKAKLTLQKPDSSSEDGSLDLDDYYNSKLAKAAASATTSSSHKPQSSSSSSSNRAVTSSAIQDSVVVPKIDATKYTVLLFPKQGGKAFLKLIQIEACGTLPECDEDSSELEMLL